jgi:hypothetical protein
VENFLFYYFVVDFYHIFIYILVCLRFFLCGFGGDLGNSIFLAVDGRMRIAQQGEKNYCGFCNNALTIFCKQKVGTEIGLVIFFFNFQVENIIVSQFWKLCRLNFGFLNFNFN